MSQHNKLNLWQKLKLFLTTSAPQAMADAVATPHNSSRTNSVNTNTATSKANSSDMDSSEIDGSEINSSQTDTEVTAKSSFSKQSSDNSATPIVEYLKHYFHNKQWHYTYYSPRARDRQQSHHLSLRMRHKNLDCGYLFRVQESNSLLAVYGILPFLIPESHQSAALLLIGQINYDMLIGNLEMDVNDGEIRYKNAIDIDVIGINTDIIEHLLQSVIAMTTVAYEIFGDLISTEDPAKDMSTLLIELRQQADARTFFLPTQFVQ